MKVSFLFFFWTSQNPLTTNLPALFPLLLSVWSLQHVSSLVSTYPPRNWIAEGTRLRSLSPRQMARPFSLRWNQAGGDRRKMSWAPFITFFSYSERKKHANVAFLSVGWFLQNHCPCGFCQLVRPSRDNSVEIFVLLKVFVSSLIYLDNAPSLSMSYLYTLCQGHVLSTNFSPWAWHPLACSCGWMPGPLIPLTAKCEMDWGWLAAQSVLQTEDGYAKLVGHVRICYSASVLLFIKQIPQVVPK